MAYMSQEKKKVIKANLDKVLKGTGVKYSLSVRNHSTIVCTIKSAPIDFIGNYNSFNIDNPKYAAYGGFRPAKDYLDVNPYWYHEHFSGKAKDILGKIIDALKSAGHYDHSDAQVDYFDCAYYYNVQIGKWKKPFEVK